jgi:hypothetical protein
MGMWMHRRGDDNPMNVYAPAFDVSNVVPGVCTRVVHGLREENWPTRLRRLVDHYQDVAAALGYGGLLAPDGVGSEVLHGALLRYIRAIKESQVDPDVTTVDQAYAKSEFDRVDPLVQVLVLASLMDLVTAAFVVATKERTVLKEDGTPVREDIQAAMDAAEAALTRPAAPKTPPAPAARPWRWPWRRSAP